MRKNESGPGSQGRNYSATDYVKREIAISRNEEFWLEVIRNASGDTDPSPTLATVHAIRAIFRQARIDRHRGHQ